jgi:hypothetical protein
MKAMWSTLGKASSKCSVREGGEGGRGGREGVAFKISPGCVGDREGGREGEREGGRKNNLMNQQESPAVPLFCIESAGASYLSSELPPSLSLSLPPSLPPSLPAADYQ